MAHKTQGNKVYCTYTIDEDVKKQFNMACATLDLKMSEVVQSMMENFLDISRAMEKAERDRLESNKGDAEIHEVEIVLPSGRLELEDNG